MICEFIKTESNLKANVGVNINNMEYQKKFNMIPFKACIIARNNIVCDIEGSQKSSSYDINASFYNEVYRISFWKQSSNIETMASSINMISNMLKGDASNVLQQTILPKIYDANGNQIGEMQYISVNREKMQSYYYYNLVLNNVELKCYVIGHGSKEIFFVMYDKNENIVATVSKRMNVKNAKARYTIYMDNEQWFKYTAIATICIHEMIYNDNEEQISLGSQAHSLNTYQKELLAKYNPNYIKNIIQREDASNIPENMTLVAEKVKEGQSTFILNYRRIGLILFIVFFALLLLIFFLR